MKQFPKIGESERKEYISLFFIPDSDFIAFSVKFKLLQNIIEPTIPWNFLKKFNDLMIKFFDLTSIKYVFISYLDSIL